MIIRPYVFRLPHARGFLAGFGEGAGMWGSVTRAIWETAAEASSAAHHEAEQAAERERDREDEPEDYEGDSYTAHIDCPAPDTPCRCGSCDWRGPFRKLHPIGEAYLTPGDPSPAGRCPEDDCESLAYIAD